MIDPHLAGKVILVTGANHRHRCGDRRGSCRSGRQGLHHLLPPSLSVFGRRAARMHAPVGSAEMFCIGRCSNSPPAALVERIRTQAGVAYAHEIDLADANNIPLLFEYVRLESR